MYSNVFINKMTFIHDNVHLYMIYILAVIIHQMLGTPRLWYFFAFDGLQLVCPPLPTTVEIK